MAYPQALSSPDPQVEIAGGLTLRTLGHFDLARAPGELLLGPGKPLALVTYLHALPGQTASRDHLLHILWADLHDKPARHALRQTVWYLRQHLGDDALVVGSGAVALAAPVQSDSDAFLEAVGDGRLADAVRIYSGEFLADLVVPGGLSFEHWADSERQRFRLLFQRAAESLARALLTEGRFRQARDVANRMREADPLDETGWRLVLETAIAGGDRVSALADAQRLEELLAAEVREPEPATRAMLLRARAEPGDSAQSENPGLVADLVGREREFAALVSALRRARRAGGQIVEIVAPAGLGKTRLLRDFARRLAANGQAAAYVRALPADRELAWSYTAELVRQLTMLPGAAGVSPAAASSLAALDPSVSGRWSAVAPDPTVGDEAFRRRVAALAELVRTVGEERPLALLLDDLHWADPTSRDVLDRVAARLQDVSVLVVFASRPGPGLKPAGTLETILLDPLDSEQTGGFVASLGELPVEPWADGFAANLRATTNGSPLLLLETLKLALDTGCLVLADGHWRCPDPPALYRLLEAGSALSRRIAQLDQAEGRLLLVLALAGSPVATQTLASASGDEGPGTLGGLVGLERRGLIARIGADWSVAHDEIAEQARELATPEQQAAGHAALGRALLERASDAGDLRFAARHLAAASLDQELAQAGERRVRMARSTGDKRPTRAVVAELLGTGTDDGRVRRLVAAVPWSVRYGPLRSIVLAAAAAAVLVTAATLFAIWKPLTDDPSVTVATWQREADGRWRMYARGVTRQDLADGAIAIGSLHRTNLMSPDRPRGAIRPGVSGSLVTTETFPDSGGEEVVLVSAGARPPIRLTVQKGDDVAGDWSPDGRYLVIQTDRWTDRSMSDLAVVDPDSSGSVVVRLTDKPAARDVLPLWSPDGSRIAFTRAIYDRPNDRERSLCLVSMDGYDESCLRVPWYTADHLVGWASPVEVVGVFVDSTGGSRILALNTETGEHRELAEGANTGFQSNAPGWIACFCRRTAGEPFQSLLFPVARPEQAVRLEPGDPPPELGLLPSGRGKAYLDRLLIDGAGRPLPADGEYQLRLRGWDAEGRPVEPLAVRWSSGDTTVATVSRAGIIHPRRAGRVTISATAGGWRTDSAVVTIAPAETLTEIVEGWTEPFETRWAPFGEPRPIVVQTTHGSALAPNGDSTFTSGVYLRRALPTGDGLGVEFDFSAPITSRSWQDLGVKFISTAMADFSQWDHRTGHLPIGDTPRWRSCGIYYPNEGQRDQIQLQGGIRRVVPITAAAAPGAWVRVRIQVFPDGRCGLAVDGRALAVLERPIPLGDSALLIIDGYSHRTRILVGPLSVWLGVRRDVDWGTVRPGPLRPTTTNSRRVIAPQ